VQYISRKLIANTSNAKTVTPKRPIPYICDETSTKM
jgi:hypothetical protein